MANPNVVLERLKEHASDRFFELKEGVWLAAFEGTSQLFAEKLGIRDGSSGTGLVMPISNYSGWASGDLWEWFKVNWPSEKARSD